MRATTVTATALASMNLPPEIQSPSAITTSTANTISRQDIRPSFCSSPAAQSGTSDPPFTTGG